MPPVQIFTRDELYARLWCGPQAALAEELGVKPWLLRKLRIEAAVPIPPRGYWGRPQAGVPMPRPAPSRPPGAAAVVTFGHYGTWWRRRSEMLVDPIPVEPQFPQPIHEMVELALGNFRVAGVPQAGRRASDRHSRFLQALRAGLALVDSGLEASGTQPSPLCVRVGCVKVALALDVVHAGVSPLAESGLQLRVGGGEFEQVFRDDPPLEGRLREIVAAVLTVAEVQYRAFAERHYAWCLDRRSEATRDARERKRRAEKILAERREGRVDRRRQRLYGQADAWRLARDIRGLVSEVLTEAQDAGRVDQRTRWAQWARSEADLIDPLLNGDLKAPDGG